MSTGNLVANRSQILAWSAEDYLQSVAQTFTALGLQDLRHSANGMIDFPLHRMLWSYHKADLPPNGVKPVPVLVLHCIIAVAQALNNLLLEAAADMIAMAFYNSANTVIITSTHRQQTPTHGYHNDNTLTLVLHLYNIY